MKITLLNYSLTLKQDKPMKSNYLHLILFACFLSTLSTIPIHAQQAHVSLDRDSILIGEQAIYTIEVETNIDDVVQFPEGQTFVPLEAIEAFKIDTNQLEPKLKLSRQYVLTQFDSGSYTIPEQFIQINESGISTDSLKIYVQDVVVDTTKQGLFPVKTYMEMERPFHIPKWLWWVLLLLGVAIGLFFLIQYILQKRKEAKENIPPYQKAIQSLQQLDESPLIKERNLREYYSVLTNISRRYLEDKIELRALEFTTNELIDELQRNKDAKKILIQQATIDDFRKILERSDLAKFARSQPDVLTAKEDRKFIQSFTDEVDQGIPEPTEEELAQDAAFRAKKVRKQKRVKLALGVLAILLITSGAITYLIASKGYDYVRDHYFGHPSKELLEGNWVTSQYGVPPVGITTPEVLVRGNSEMTQEAEKILTDSETFVAGGIYGNFHAVLSIMQFQQDVDFNLESIVEGVYAILEAEGAYNILVKEGEIKTLDGAEGKLVSGNFAIENPFTKNDIKKEYKILNFAEMGAFQQLILIYDADDQYAEEISRRVINSLELRTQ